MAEATFLEQKSVRPGSAAVVILMHGAALAALLLAKNEFIDKPVKPTTVVDIPLEDEPPPEPPPPRPTEPPQEPLRYTAPTSPIPVPTPGPLADNRPAEIPDRNATDGPELVRDPPQLPQRETVPPPPPVRVEAQLDSRSELQPPYPPSEERAGREGRVVIRVRIGTNGRVVAAEQVSATSPAFYSATERQARGRWRFRPATVDGRPVESNKTMTVHFRLEG